MPIHKRNLPFFFALLLGVIAFFLVVGHRALDPINAEWILGRLDPTQHYLGWLFYRTGEWSFPIGLNPRFGQDLSSSIVYSDSIPLLAIPFKALDPFLPDRFHYFGIWILACFVLQAGLAWKLLGLYTDNALLKLLGCGLFIFFPPLLWRVNTPAGGHAALVAHFLVLWALYLLLRPIQSKRTLLWVMLLCITVLTHFYLFVIVALLWLTDLANRYIAQKQFNKRQVFQEIFIAFICIFLAAWQAGYFAISASLNNERGYGFYGMNVLGLIDPQGWSYVLRDSTHHYSWGEGFAYMGLGAIIAAIFALMPALARYSNTKKTLASFFSDHWFLGVLIIALTIFAISNRIGVGDWSYTYDLPASVQRIADVLRSSARLFWPIQYLLLIGIFVGIIRHYSGKAALWILLLCAVLQIADTSRGWIKNRNQLAVAYSSDKYAQNLSNPFWEALGKHYRDLTLVPSINSPPNWENFAVYAATYGMRTNAVHMARIDLVKQEESNLKLNTEINTGKFNRDILYVVENRFVIAALASAPSDTLIAKVDTFNIIAPNWNSCASCPSIDPALVLGRNRYTTKLGQVISFANSSPYRSYYLRQGWSWSEDWGTWTDSDKAILNLSWPLSPTKTIILEFDTFVVKGKYPKQEIDVLVNGVFYQKLLLTQVYENELEILFTPEMKKAKFLSIEFKMYNSARPVDFIADRPDHRKLGVGLRTAVFK
jgi:hypothetical protein